MAIEVRNIERFLSVGAVAMLHTEAKRKDGPRYKTVIRGWRRGNHVLADRPRTEQGAFAALSEGQECIFRYVHEGQACAFGSKVIEWDNRKHNAYLRLAWPESLEFMSFRRFERVRVQMQCLIRPPGSQPIAGEIRDISVGGCGIVCDFSMEGEATLKMQLFLPDGREIDDISLVVRNSRQVWEGYFIGCEFGQNTPMVQNELAFFVSSLMTNQGAELPREAPARVLIIDSDPEMAQKLRKQFERQHLDSIIAQTTVDGLHRLRATPPSVVLIANGMKDLAGPTLCGVIRQCADYADTPIYVYGAKTPEADSDAQLAGATRVYQHAPSLAADLAYDVAQDLRQTPGAASRVA